MTCKGIIRCYDHDDSQLLDARSPFVQTELGCESVLNYPVLVSVVDHHVKLHMTDQKLPQGVNLSRGGGGAKFKEKAQMKLYHCMLVLSGS